MNGSGNQEVAIHGPLKRRSKMKPSRIFSIAQSVILAFGIILIVSGFSHSTSLRLEKYDGGIFTISKPEGWENRNRTYDIIAQKRSDAILGKE